MRCGLCLGLAALVVILPLPSHAEEARDPFTFSPRTNRTFLTNPILVGILWDVAHPLAIVGEETVGIGDTIDGWQVVDIQPNHIALQRDMRRELLEPGASLP